MSNFYFGGGEEIRTPALFHQPNALAVRPLRPDLSTPPYIIVLKTGQSLCFTTSFKSGG